MWRERSGTLQELKGKCRIINHRMITSSRESRSLMSIVSSPALPHPRKPDNCLFLQRPEDELASLAGPLSRFVLFLGKKCQRRSLRQIRREDCSRLLHDNCVCELKQLTCSCDKQSSFHSSGSLKFGDVNGLPRPGPESQPLSHSACSAGLSAGGGFNQEFIGSHSVA